MLENDPEEQNNVWSGDGCREKSALMAELQSISESDNVVETFYSKQEQRQTKKHLRVLGYVD